MTATQHNRQGRQAAELLNAEAAAEDLRVRGNHTAASALKLATEFRQALDDTYTPPAATPVADSLVAHRELVAQNEEV